MRVESAVASDQARPCVERVDGHLLQLRYAYFTVPSKLPTEDPGSRGLSRSSSVNDILKFDPADVLS